MKRSTHRILTTHTGSLPRPAHLLERIAGLDQRGLREDVGFAAGVSDAVRAIVRQQVETGLDVINDGEMSKVSYATYVTDRLTGFEGENRGRPEPIESTQYPDFYAGRGGVLGSVRATMPACTGPIAWRGTEQVERDIANLKQALEGVEVEEVFVSAASPGVVWYFLENQYYPNHEAYLQALAEALREEYNALHRAGFLVQLDCPDLAGGWNRPQFRDASLDDFRKHVTQHVEALNYAVADIPPDRLRMHICWGNYEAPHTRDVPIGAILDILLSARPAALSFEAANPRHAHEWKSFRDVNLPDGKVLIPGVLDSTTNFVEHPELVAERIARFAEVAGRENVIAGTDCGFATFAGTSRVHPSVTWVKLAALVEGARLASRELWT